MRAVLLTFAAGVCTAARDVSCLVSPMVRETFTVYTNLPLVMPPPLTGTTEQKAATVLNRLQDICAQEYPPLNKDGWIQNIVCLERPASVKNIGLLFWITWWHRG